MRTKHILLLATVLVGLFCQEARAFYNSHTGRWLSRDPIEESGGKNIYEALDDDPTSKYDILGKKVLNVVFGTDTSTRMNSKTKRLISSAETFLWEMIAQCLKMKDCDCPNLDGIGTHFTYDENTKDKPAPKDLDCDLGEAGELELFRGNAKKIKPQNQEAP